MALSQAQVEAQKKEVAELLGEVERLGFAKSIFFGRVRGDLLFPYPTLSVEQQRAADEAYGNVKKFADMHIDAAKVPLLHVYGDADEVVPWDENTGVVAERYKKLGGSITLIAKPGVKHHPHGLDDSTPIIQFISTNSNPRQTATP